MDDDDLDDEALQRMGGEEMAIMMGVTTDNYDQQMQTAKEIGGVRLGKIKEDQMQTSVTAG